MLDLLIFSVCLFYFVFKLFNDYVFYVVLFACVCVFVNNDCDRMFFFVIFLQFFLCLFSSFKTNCITISFFCARAHLHEPNVYTSGCPFSCPPILVPFIISRANSRQNNYKNKNNKQTDDCKYNIQNSRFKNVCVSEYRYI